MWVFLTIASALFLGIYEVMKKISVQENAVLPVLLVSSLFGSFVFVFPVIFSQAGIIDASSLFYVPPVSFREHLLILLKTLIVISSWILAFLAIKHLPLTIVSPIRSTSPLWTLVGAIIIFAERLSPLQWTGMILTLTFFYLFSTAGKLEGITFRNNKYMWFIVFATLISAVSGLYDKFLLKIVDRMAVQAYFTFYQVALFTPIVLTLWWPKRGKMPFSFRWSIPLIGLFLLAADFLYFYAVQYPDSLISVITALRRSSVIIAFLAGAILFREKNIGRKVVFLVGILAGILLLIFGR